MLYWRSLQFIILAPVVAFLVFAGIGIFVLISTSVEDFADRHIRENFGSLARAAIYIADREKDLLDRTQPGADRVTTMIHQATVFEQFENFSQQNGVGVIIYDLTQDSIRFDIGLPVKLEEILRQTEKGGKALVDIVKGGSFYARSDDFEPWNWRIILIKDSAAFSTLVKNIRYFYVATGIVIILMAVAGVIYLRRAIGRPINQMVNRFREGKSPEYKGIREFEFLSDSIGTMMKEVSETRAHLEDLVRARTTQLEEANKIAVERNTMLGALSAKLSKYLSPQVYASIFSGQQHVEIASSRKKLTVMFSDIVAFTTATDKLQSEELTQLLNQYLTAMSEVALQYGGTIDKYIGDAIMIFFGDPESRGVKDDALACAKTAIGMQKRVRELGEAWREAGLEWPLACRIGIHTGFCTVGNFGSEDRMDYTIIGGTVNLASRLEDEAPPGGILVSYETHALIKDEVLCEESGQIKVKGIAYPVATYQVVDLYENLSADKQLVQVQLPNLSLDLDPGSMSAVERVEAKEALQTALSRLSQDTTSEETETAEGDS